MTLRLPDRFVFGAQYYRPPNPPHEDWARDLARMREHGMNTVKYWACWSWMHRGPGDIDFTDLDELMRLASENELAVVMNIILENAPYWLEREVPEARYHDHDDVPFPLTAAMNTPGGGWPGLCFDNERPRAAATEFLRAIIERYRDHPALAVWDVWNEPHLEPNWYYPDRLYCYCEGSLAAFRRWLEERHGSLDRLNAAWRRRYSDWAEVSPPRVLETYPDYLDWREFWLTNLRRWLDWKVAVARELDAVHPVMTHVASSAYLGTLTANVWDEWLLAEPVDLYGTSSFPRWLMDDDPVVHLFHLEMTRDAGQGKPMWQAELQGGRGRRQGDASTAHPSPSAITSWIWHNLAIGSKGVVFWQWRPELLGPESPGYGLCTPSGDATERTAAAAAMAKLLADFPELAHSKPAPPTVGILVSRKTPLLAYATERTMALYAGSLLGAYRAFIDHDVAVRFLHEDRLELDGVPEEINSIYWPMPHYVSHALASALVGFVEGGGLLTAEGSPGSYVDGGSYAPTAPPGLLRELFGGELVDSDISASITVSVTGPSIRGAWGYDRIEPTSAETLGWFADGSTALLKHTSGEGTAKWIGTYPSLAYERDRHPDTGAWIASAATDGKSGRLPGLLTREHYAGDDVLLIALNLSEHSLHVGMPRRQAVKRLSEAFSQTPTGLELNLAPRAGGIAVLGPSTQGS